MSVFELIVGQGRRGPDRPAAKDLTRELTYRQLLAEVAEMAAGLRAEGVVIGDRVAVHLPNSLDFVVTALGALSLGAAFVPLAVADPEARLGVILDDCQPALVVSGDAGFPEGLSRHRSRPLASLRVAAGAPAPALPPDDARAAYAIYTSGTTGTPKGVLIGDGAFQAAVLAAIDALGLDSDTRTLCVSPFHFDGSFGTLFPTLVAGGSVVVLPRDSLLFPRTFFNAVAREGITYTGFSPSYLRLLLGDRQRSKLAATALRVVALGGEASSAADVAMLWEIAPELRVFNRYGPTETTIAVTHCELSPARVGKGPVPIGRPHPGVTFYLVDEQGSVISDVGAVGELYVGGDQLMTGYWRAPQLTEAVLRTDIVAGETVYRTGDLVLRNQAGDYVYVDRADRVIKRSGVRISLIEVADVLRHLPGVSAATSASFDDDGRLGIVAFVTVESDLSELDIKRMGAEHLADTMLPDRIIVVDELPLTTSSKVDERRLLAAAGLREPLRS
jgi:D-alanine--poly(phosphoribitol) ligase subunit 1